MNINANDPKGQSNGSYLWLFLVTNRNTNTADPNNVITIKTRHIFFCFIFLCFANHGHFFSFSLPLSLLTKIFQITNKKSNWYNKQRKTKKNMKKKNQIVNKWLLINIHKFVFISIRNWIGFCLVCPMIRVSGDDAVIVNSILTLQTIQCFKAIGFVWINFVDYLLMYKWRCGWV